MISVCMKSTAQNRTEQNGVEFTRHGDHRMEGSGWRGTV